MPSRLLRSRRPVTVVLACAVLIAGLFAALSAPPVRALQGPVDWYYFEDPNTEVHEGPVVELIRVPPKTLQAGQTIFLQGRVTATNSGTRNVGQVAELGCLGPAGDGHVGEVRATRNHEGSDFPYATPGQLHVLVDYTFTAPATGTYTCRLNATAWTDADPDVHYLNIVPNLTRLLVSHDVQDGAHNWLTKECNSGGTSPTCLYIGAPGHPATTYVFYSDFNPRYIWRADPAADFVEARAVLQLTTCYVGTGSCINSVDQYGTDDWSTVRVRLQLIQLDANNMACKTTETGPTTYTISRDAHHYALTETIARADFNPSCPRNFILRIYVTHGSGAPVKIDGVSEGFIQTNGTVFNRYVED